MVLQYGPQWNDISIVLLDMLSIMALCPLVPRFIPSLRELYDRNLAGRWRGIDTTFGGSSQSIPSRSFAIAFAGISSKGLVVEGCVHDLVPVIPLKVVGNGAHQV